MGIFVFDETSMCLNRHDARTQEIKTYLKHHQEITKNERINGYYLKLRIKRLVNIYIY